VAALDHWRGSAHPSHRQCLQLRTIYIEHYGLQFCEETGLPSGTIYPIVARLEQLGWVASSWEDPAEHVTEGRPRRRYYRLTDDGAEQARDALARAYRPSKQPRPGFGVPWPDLPGISS
jgi:PadR family transcriptional regulator PadR